MATWLTASFAENDDAAQMQPWNDQKHASHLLTVITSANLNFLSLVCLCGELAQSGLLHEHYCATTPFPCREMP